MDMGLQFAWRSKDGILIGDQQGKQTAFQERGRSSWAMKESMYCRIYSVVNMVPPGKVATYGQIARIAGRCSARNVGYAMSSIPPESDVPWHRIINSRGNVSIRSHGERCTAQRKMLETEGIVFSTGGSVDLHGFGWEGPPRDTGSDER